MMKWDKWKLWVGGAAVLCTLFLAGVIYRKVFWYKKFGIVEPGILLRSGQLHSWQMSSAIKTYGIKTVFSFTYADHENEERVCREAGVRRYFHYLPGDGVGPDDPYLRFLEVVRDPANYPVLVHCTAGVQRTGGAVALFRTVVQKGDFEKAIEEMLSYGNEGFAEQIDQIRRLTDRYQTARHAGKEIRPTLVR